jgi:predicted Zn-dependent protease
MHRFCLRQPSWLVSLGLLAALAWPVLTPAQGNSVLPGLGDSVSEELSVAAERRLGDRIMQELRRDPDVLDDPLLLDYVQGIWQPLLGAARRRGELSEELDAHEAWEPFLVRDRTVNAFALPGGYVGVHLGLISLTSSRDELAAVLAHELSHVTQRHIARMMASSRRQSLLGLASMIAGVLVASRNPEAASAMITGGQAGVMQGQLNFSRDMEREADRVGFGVLSTAGYAPAGMMQMFDKLQLASRLNDNQQYPYLRSHPLTSERIGEARQRLGLDMVATAPVGTEGLLWLHAAMQGRARALMDGRSQTLQRLAAGAAAVPINGPEALTAAYAGTLAAVRLKDRAAADAGLARCLALAANQPAALRAVQLLQVEVALQHNQPAEALQLWQRHLDDGSRTGLLLGTDAALAMAGADAARGAPLLRTKAEALQTWVALHPTDPAAWAALAQVQDGLGLNLAALRAHAEEHFALGDLAGAADRFRAGQRLARSSGKADSVESSVIDARLKAIEKQRRQEQLDARAAGQGEPQPQLGAVTDRGRSAAAPRR